MRRPVGMPVLRTASAALALAAALALGAAGCQPSLARQDEVAKQRFFRGDFPGAAQSLDPVPQEQGHDRVLFLMERGTILHAAGQYEDSNHYLLQAAEMVDSLPLTRISEQIATIVTNETAADYLAEDHERVLLHVYLAINYAVLGNFQDALVECKKINDTLKWIADQRGVDFRQNAFALYLSGVIHETFAFDTGNLADLNEAYQFYKDTARLAPHFAYAQYDLLRLSRRLGMTQEYDDYRKRFGRDGPEVDWKTNGEVVVILQPGLVPVKVPNPAFPIVPTVAVRPTPTVYGSVFVGEQLADRTWSLNDVEATVVQNFRQQEGPLIAKRAVILAAKAVATEEIRKRNQLAGVLVGAFFAATEKADLRCWLTLPRDLQMARMALAVGEYDITLRQFGAGGQPTGDHLWRRVRIEPGRRVFLNARTVY
ncbi:MAG: hypothetical protein HYZ53_15710 [Planctomycetes bacterium]|nr:hypothetical protein [Planctomycetota bacterium]